VLLVNASRLFHLNPSAAAMAYTYLNDAPVEKAIQNLTHVFRVEPSQARQDYLALTGQLDALINPDGPCPICELAQQLKFAGDKASMKMSENLRVRKTYWMNIIVRGKLIKTAKGESREEDTGPFIYTPGIQVMTAISNLINDPDYGDVLDVNTGLDLTIKRVGEGMKTEYTVTPRRNASALSDDSDLAEEWLSKVKDLSVVEVTDDPDDDKTLTKDHAVFIMPYDRIVREFQLDEGISTEDDEEAADEEEIEEEPAPVRHSAKTTTPSHSVVKPTHRHPEPEDDDEEIEEEEPEPKKEVERRLLKRKIR
jgi:hypothetical protein